MNPYLEAIKELESHGVVFNRMMVEDMNDLTWGYKYRTLGCPEHFDCHTDQPGWEYCRWNAEYGWGYDRIPTKEQYMKILTLPKKEGEIWKWYFGCENQGCAEFFAMYKTAEDDPVIEYHLNVSEVTKILEKYNNWQTFKDVYKMERGDENDSLRIERNEEKKKGGTIIRKNKSIGKYWHPLTKLVFEERVVIGKLVKGEVKDLDDEDVRVCKNWRFAYKEPVEDSEGESEEEIGLSEWCSTLTIPQLRREIEKRETELEYLTKRLAEDEDPWRPYDEDG